MMELEIIRGLTRQTGEILKEELPGPVVHLESFGDFKRRIDKLANNLIEDYLLKSSREYGFPIMGRTEHGARWFKFENKEKKEIPLSQISSRIREGAFGVVVDEVDGTKNLQNKDRFTTAIAFDPERPNMDGVLCSSVYRWSGEEYYFDGEKSYYLNCLTGENGEMKVAETIDELDSTVKIKGCFICNYLWMWEVILEVILQNYELEELKMPCFCGNGVTTEDLLSTVLDRSIAIDPRALDQNAKRKPYTYDVAPAAAIVASCKINLHNFDLKQFNMDLLEPNFSLAYCAVPNGRIGEKIKGLLPEIKERIEKRQ